MHFLLSKWAYVYQLVGFLLNYLHLHVYVHSDLFFFWLSHPLSELLQYFYTIFIFSVNRGKWLAVKAGMGHIPLSWNYILVMFAKMFKLKEECVPVIITKLKPKIMFPFQCTAQLYFSGLFECHSRDLYTKSSLRSNMTHYMLMRLIEEKLNLYLM